MKTTCPNCEGFGIIYTTDPVKYDTEALRCRACDGRGYIYQEEEKRMEDQRTEMLYATDGRGTVVALPGKKSMIGVSRCHPEDRYDEALGIAIAVLKMTRTPSLQALDFAEEIEGGAKQMGEIDFDTGALIDAIAGFRAAVEREKTVLTSDFETARSMGLRVIGAIPNLSAIAIRKGRDLVRAKGKT